MWSVYSVTQSGQFLLSLFFVVADHHRHHSWESEFVEARVVKVAEVTAHAVYFQVPSLSPAGDGAGSHPGGRLGGPGGQGAGGSGVPPGPRRASGS